MSQLTPEQRAFFSLVRQAVIANPFSPEREEIDLTVTGLAKGADISLRISAMVTKITAMLDTLDGGRVALGRYRGQDLQILKASVLFLFFHLFLERFDRHIQSQLDAEDTPEKIDFAKEGLSFLRDRGFDDKEALFYFALSFQLRRAFFFIDRNIKGVCPSMTDLKAALWNNVFTNSLDIYETHLWNRMEDFSTLILGETGTGKGAVAAAIGRSGFIPFDPVSCRFKQSFNRSFLSLNLSQFAETLIESELFGHKKGAFTGAVQDREGILDRASAHGAIFLDEIGEVATPLQIKLLKVLEERTYYPVGGYEAKTFKGRIIAATNRPLDEIADEKVFRPDFFYRLCSDMIIMPPLRQRFKENPLELDELLGFTIEKILGEPSKELEQMVKKAIGHRPGRHYTWPGNVREFAQCVRRIMLTHQYKSLKGQVQQVRPADSNSFSAKIDKGDLTAAHLVRGYCHFLYQTCHSYGEVAKITRLDWRTVKKYIQEWEPAKQP